MVRYLTLLLCMLCIHVHASSYQDSIMAQVARKLPELTTYPFLHYPNENRELVQQQFGNKKVPIFGYGSLMNVESARQSMKVDAIASMQPVVAFGVKRIFNYTAKYAHRWGNLHSNERAMLNLIPTYNTSSIANGVVIEVDDDDLVQLIKREVGYDLIPVLVASWDEISAKKPILNIRVAYTFVASSELRKNMLYTHTRYYPVRGYMQAVQEGALRYGDRFLDLWNATTYLADGTTLIDEWDPSDFTETLQTARPYYTP